MWNYRTTLKARKHHKRLMNKSIERLFWFICIGLLAVFYLFLMLSCSANRHVDKAVMKESPKYVIDYVVGKYGDSYLPQIRDTLIDTIYVAETLIDTFKVTSTIDTIVVSKDNVITKVFRHYDTIWVSTEVKRDTIIRVVYKDRYVVSPSKDKTKSIYTDVSIWLGILLMVVVVFGIILLFFKLNK